MKNEYVICGDVTEIVLPHRSGERVVALIDTSSLDIADSYPGTWYRIPVANGRRYVRGSQWESSTRRNINLVLLHRLVMDAPTGFDVDHQNHNGLDNRSSNLRVVSRSTNLLNRRGNDSNNTSGYRGVFWDDDKKRFRAVVEIRGKRYRLGRHRTAEQAASAVYAFLLSIDPVAAQNYPPILNAAGAA